jgi:hypothetical protein
MALLEAFLRAPESQWARLSSTASLEVRLRLPGIVPRRAKGPVCRHPYLPPGLDYRRFQPCQSHYSRFANDAFGRCPVLAAPLLRISLLHRRPTS